MPPPPPEPAATVWERLAEAAFAAGRADAAGECLRLAAAPPAPLTPAEADARHQQALAHLQAGKPAEAVAALKQVLAAEPGRAYAHDHLGVALAHQGQFAAAAATFGVAARLDPGNPSPRRNRARALLDARDFARAADALRAALELEPRVEELRLQLAVALAELKRYAESMELLEGWLAESPNSPDLWNRLGVVRGLAGRAEGAIACFERQRELDPTGASAPANLAAAHGRLKQFDRAMHYAWEAIARDPAHAGGWANLGNAQRDAGQVPEAIDSLQKAIQLDPTSPESFGNLALAFTMTGRVEEALPAYERSLKLRPDAAEVRFNRAIALLSLGDYARGWPEYEWRWGTEQMQGLARRFERPPWRGEPLAGKTLLVHCEQGHGDTLQFVRLLAGPAFCGARVVVAAAEAVRRLLASFPAVHQVLTPDDALPAFDYHAPLLTLPLLTRLRLDAIPGAVPYLAATPEAIERGRELIAARVGDRPGRLVGVAWQGNPKHIGDRWRSVPLAHLAPLAAVPGVTLVSLQKGPGAEQLADSSLPIVDLLSDYDGDFADTAGVVTDLDAVVTIDSAVAHLAGALGKPVWVALPLNADWRWLLRRPDSPWYPTARLVRQAAFRQWGGVFERIAGELTALPRLRQ